MYKQRFDFGYRSDNKADKVSRVIAAKTRQSIFALNEYSFEEMLKLVKDAQNQELKIQQTTEQFIDEGNYKTIMFTVSSSDFRLVALLHFLPKEELTDEAWNYLRLEQNVGTQQFHDYICELGNNFCGAICRALNAANYSTGMSTPAILANVKPLENLQNIGVDLNCHLSAGYDKTPIFCASICLVLNKNMTADLNIPIPASMAEAESHGELEFF